MKFAKALELWSNIGYLIFNFYSLTRFQFIDRFRLRRHLNKNRILKDCHKGQRCFIVLNGPSVNDYDFDSTDIITGGPLPDMKDWKL